MHIGGIAQGWQSGIIHIFKEYTSEVWKQQKNFVRTVLHAYRSLPPDYCTYYWVTGNFILTSKPDYYVTVRRSPKVDERLAILRPHSTTLHLFLHSLFIDFSQGFHRDEVNALRWFEIVETGQTRNPRVVQPSQKLSNQDRIYFEIKHFFRIWIYIIRKSYGQPRMFNRVFENMFSTKLKLFEGLGFLKAVRPKLVINYPLVVICDSSGDSVEPKPQCCSVFIMSDHCEILRVIRHNRYPGLGNGSNKFGNHCQG